MTYKLSAGVYRIKNPRSGTYMACSPQQVGVVHGWQSDVQDDFQKWELQSVGDGYHIRNVGNGRFLTKTNNAEGTRVQVTTKPTKWTLPRLHEGTFRIVAGDRHVDIDWSRIENGTKIHLFAHRDVLEQMWRFKRVSSQASDMRKSLEDTRKRLAAVEEKANNQQTELAAVKKSLNSANDRAVAAEKAAAEMRERLSTLAASVTAGANRLSDLADNKVPAIAAKAADLGKSIARNEDQSVAMRTSIAATGGRLDHLDRNVTVLQATSDILKASFEQSQDRLSTMEGVVDQLGKQYMPLPLKQMADDATPGQQPPSPTNTSNNQDISAIQRSLVSVRHQVNGLDKRVPMQEARTDELQGSFVQNQERLSSMEGFLRAVERKLPALEAKTGRIKVLQDEMREEIAAVRISQATQLASLDGRTHIVESRVGKLTKTLGEIQDSEGGDSWPTLPLFPARPDSQLDSS